MINLDFEHELDRMFAEAPSLGHVDDDAFAAAVNRRLDRASAIRTALIGGLGLVGGVIAMGQIAASGLVGRVATLPALSNQLVSAALNPRPPAWLSPASLSFDGAAPGGAFLWGAGAMALIAVGLATWRALDDI
jgi:hypothetical protein